MRERKKKREKERKRNKKKGKEGKREKTLETNFLCQNISRTLTTTSVLIDTWLIQLVRNQKNVTWIREKIFSVREESERKRRG